MINHLSLMYTHREETSYHSLCFKRSYSFLRENQPVKLFCILINFLCIFSFIIWVRCDFSDLTGYFFYFSLGQGSRYDDLFLGQIIKKMT